MRGYVNRADVAIAICGHGNESGGAERIGDFGSVTCQLRDFVSRRNLKEARRTAPRQGCKQSPVRAHGRITGETLIGYSEEASAGDVDRSSAIGGVVSERDRRPAIGGEHQTC